MNWLWALGIPALPFVWKAGLCVYDDCYFRYRKVQADGLKLRMREQQAKLDAIRHIPADENGRAGIMYDGHFYRNLDTGSVLTQVENLLINPLAEQIDAMQKTLLAMRGLRGQSQPVIDQLEQQMLPQLPSRVPLQSLLDGRPDYRDLILGVTIDQATGATETVRADMADLVHVAVGGSSGFGKSKFLQMLVYQLALSASPVDLALIDQEGVTFSPFANCDRLLWPVVDTERDARIVFSELNDEMNRRKELYQAHVGVDSLHSYNAQASEPLRPVICLVDEATALLEDKTIEKGLSTLSTRARKFGVWLVLGGQDWKASSLNTKIRNQLSGRIQFMAKSGSQSRVLLDQSGAEDLTVRGRALAWIPGKELIEFQAPMIGAEQIMRDVAGKGPKNDLPRLGQTDQERIIEMREAGSSKRSIEQEVYGYTGGAASRKVNEILDGATTVADSGKTISEPNLQGVG